MIDVIGGAITIAGGILAASSLIVKASPNARQLVDKLAPYQASIGAIMFGWGVWETIHAVLNMGALASMPVTWICWMLVALTDLVVGFLLGFGLIAKYTMRGNQAALERSQQVRLKLATVQAPLGFVAVLTGLLYIVWPLVARG
jgi:hypothetical protein